jgi:hypothetical protein
MLFLFEAGGLLAHGCTQDFTAVAKSPVIPKGSRTFSMVMSDG